MTLVMVVTGPPAEMPAATPLIALVGLIVPGMARNPWFWLVLFGSSVVSPIARPWARLDNHDWLEAYWLAAIASRRAIHPDATLRLAARLLVGFTFLFATTWRLISPELITGASFDVTCATDRRRTASYVAASIVVSLTSEHDTVLAFLQPLFAGEG